MNNPTHINSARATQSRLDIFFSISLLLLISARPIFDLAGESTGGTVSIGGYFAAATGTIAAIAWATTSAKNSSRSYIFLLVFIGMMSIFFIMDFNRFDSTALDRIPPGEYSFKLLFGLLPFIFLCSINSPDDAERVRQLRIFYYSFIVAISVPAIISVAQFLGYAQFSYFDYVNGTRIGRPSGGYRQPNSLARLFVFAIIFTYMASRENIIPKVTRYAICTASISIIFLSTHRTSLAIALLVIIIFELSLGNVFKKIAFAAGAAAAIGAAGFVSAILDTKTASIITNVISSDGISMRGRAPLFQQAIYYFDSLPVIAKLFGTGQEAFIIDNGYLAILVSQGLYGLASFLIVIFGFAYISRRKSVSGQMPIPSICAIATVMIYMLIMNAHTATLLIWLLGTTLYFDPTRALRKVQTPEELNSAMNRSAPRRIGLQG